MANIVAVTRFTEPGSEVFSSYINYMDRESAVRKDNAELYNIFSEYMDYMDDELKTIVDGEKKLEKVSALFTQNHDSLSMEEKTELKEIFKEAENNGSNMWQTVISFENSYLEDLGIYDSDINMLNEKALRKASRKAISEMLKKEGMENAFWTASFHYNTDNIHIHIATVERVPTREKKEYTVYVKDKDGRKVPKLNSDGEPVTYEAYKGVFKMKSIETLKSVMRSELEDDKTVYSEISDLIRKSILQDKKDRNLLDEPDFKDGMKKLYISLKGSGINIKNWSYNQNQLSEIRPEIDDLSEAFINIYHRDDYTDLLAKIEKEEQRQRRFYGESARSYKETLLYGRDGLFARLGNAILKELKTYERELNNEKNEMKKAVSMLDKDDENFDPNRAIKTLKELSMRGNVFAQNQLGLIYLKGEFVLKNEDLAKGYFVRSAENGNSFGKYMYEKLSNNRADSTMTSMDPLQGSAARLVRRGIKRLEYDLRRNYESFRNQREAEMLQYEIEHRGEEI